MLVVTTLATEQEVFIQATAPQGGCVEVRHYFSGSYYIIYACDGKQGTVQFVGCSDFVHSENDGGCSSYIPM